MILKLMCAVLAMVLASGPASATNEARREQSEKILEAKDLTGVRIENSRGVVTVRRGSAGRVRLSALKIVRGNHREQTDRYARETQVVTSREAGKLLVKVRYPQRQSIRIGFWDMFSGYELPRVEMQLELEIPDGFTAELHSTSGDLVTEDLSGAQTLETTSGDVAIHGARSAVRVTSTSGDISAAGLSRGHLETVSGNVEVDGAGGVLRIDTTSGDVSIQGARDSLRLDTVSGDLQIEGAPRGLVAQSTSGDITAGEVAGTVRLESSSGDVRLGLAKPLGRATVNTVSGDIVVTLHPSLGCALDMQTINGTLDLSVPLEVKTVSRRRVSGVVRNGAAPVALKSSSGDIHFSSSGEL